MLTETEKKRWEARWAGEALREIAILVLVFVPLDWFLGQRENKTSIALEAFSISTLIFAAGMWVGFKGEAE